MNLATGANIGVWMRHAWRSLKSEEDKCKTSAGTRVMALIREWFNPTGDLIKPEPCGGSQEEIETWREVVERENQSGVTIHHTSTNNTTADSMVQHIHELLEGAPAAPQALREEAVFATPTVKWVGPGELWEMQYTG